jgi:hypothetical protein
VGVHPSFLQGIIIIPPGDDGAAARASHAAFQLLPKPEVQSNAWSLSPPKSRSDEINLPAAFRSPSKGQSVCLDSDIYRQTIPASATFSLFQRAERDRR